MNHFMLVPRRLFQAVALMLLLGLVAAPRARAATTITVCAAGCDFDNVPAAVAASADGDTIDIAAGDYVLIFAPPITIDKDLTLRGAGVDVTTLRRDASDYGRVITVRAGKVVTIEDLTISGGRTRIEMATATRACAMAGSTSSAYAVGAAADQPAPWTVMANSPVIPNPCGAAEHSAESALSIGISGWGGAFGTVDSEVEPVTQGPANATSISDITMRGGGLFNAGVLTLRQVKVTGNSLSGKGTASATAGEDATSATATATVVVRLLGGGIYNEGSLTIERGIISGNSVAASGEASALAAADAGSVTARANPYAVVAAGIYNKGGLYLRDSTVSANGVTSSLTSSATTGSVAPVTDSDAVVTTIGAGGIVNDGSMTTTNSTISGNTFTAASASDDENAVYAAGGVFDGRYPSTLNFTTVAANQINLTRTGIGAATGVSAGGVVTARPSDVPGVPPLPTLAAGPAVTPNPPGGNLMLYGSVVTGNTGGDCAFGTLVASVNAGYSLTGDGSCGVPQGNADLGPLADNGGPTQTHLPGPASDAIDLVPLANCAAYALTADQRGEPRPLGIACEAGSVEVLYEPSVFVSATTAGTTADGVSFGPHDILMWTASDGWSKWFDGTAAGLTPTGTARHDIDAFSITSSGELLLSFTQNARFVPGISGKVDGMDLVSWDGSAFSLYFDGQDVGLTGLTQEKIDALHALDGDMAPPAVAAAAGGSCAAYLLVSTQGPGRVQNYDGAPLRFGGEDVLGFCLTQSGATTQGKWTMALDGSAEGMPRNSTDSISVSPDGQTMYLTTKGTFNVDSAAGGHSMVYKYDFGTGTFSGPFFRAADEGLDRKVDGLEVSGELDTGTCSREHAAVTIDC